MKSKLILIYNTRAQWVDNDIEILSEKFEVKPIYINSRSHYSISVFKEIISAKVIFLWFGSLIFFPAALIAFILRKKICIVAGGYDVASFPEENYGAFTFQGWTKALRVLLFKMADIVLPVSEFTAGEAIKNAQVNPKKINVIHNCVKQFLEIKNSKENKVLMVSNIDALRFRIKGFDRFLEVVRELPDVQFTHVGEITGDVLAQVEIPSNLELRGRLGAEELQEVYAFHKIIVQFSRYESFCMTIVEGAIQGCFPITSTDGALKEVVAPIGKGINFDEKEELVEVLKATLQGNIEPSQIQKNALKFYGVEHRRNKLIDALKEHFL
jgi:glycosyltransferase involved in cell wall biosynthesis